MANKYMTTTQITSSINTLRKSVTEFNKSVQSIGVSAFAHAQEKGDLVYVTRLANAMGNGSNRKAMMDWICAFGPITVKSVKEGVGWL
jgi:hypothetical protein